LANGLLRATASAHNPQVAAHSMQHAGQEFLLSLPAMCVKQLPQAVEQALQAAMHSRASWFR